MRFVSYFAAFLAGGFVFAATSVMTATTVPNTFTGGTPAYASEVNENFSALAAKIDELETRLASVENSDVMGLEGTVALVVDPNTSQDTVRFEAVNVQIVNGTGYTNSFDGTFNAGANNGLGNLIIGYNETTSSLSPYCSDPTLNTQEDCELASSLWADNQRSGSHNLILGIFNDYTQHGTIVAGASNRTQASYSSVIGGTENIASGWLSTVTGGQYNKATDTTSTVSGGAYNIASALASSVAGGLQNNASGLNSSITGGRNNTASNEYSSVTGGSINTASGSYSSVTGGSNNTASGSFSSISGGALNMASAFGSSVSGGSDNTASYSYSSVSGGLSNTASGQNSSVSGGLNNTASGQYSSVSGGISNIADSLYGWGAGSSYQADL